MKLKILGSGSAGNCYLLQSDIETLIIECGLSYKTILKGLNFNLNNVVGVLASHSHKDHSRSILNFTNNGIDVYISADTACSCGVDGFWMNLISAEKQLYIGEFTVLPFELEHDDYNLGFLIKHKEIGKLLYITDTQYCKYSFKGLTHILIEANYSKEILQTNIENGLNPIMAQRLLKSHFSLENVKEFLKANDLSQCEDITLIHLSDSNSNAKQFKTEIERFTGIPTYIADTGLTIEL